MKYMMFLSLCFLLLLCQCAQKNNVLTVDGGGVGIFGHVYFQPNNNNNAIPLDSVKIVLKNFKGTNLQHEYSDVLFYSDSTGFFGSVGALGYYINGDDTIGRVHQCDAVFSKPGYFDTAFTVYESDTNCRHLTIFLHQ